MNIPSAVFFISQIKIVFTRVAFVLVSGLHGAFTKNVLLALLTKRVVVGIADQTGRPVRVVVQTVLDRHHRFANFVFQLMTFFALQANVFIGLENQAIRNVLG